MIYALGGRQNLAGPLFVGGGKPNLAVNGEFETDLTGWSTSGTPWWLAGGVSASNAVAAYQPIGAADLSGSLINLANAGTYNAAPGVAPTFDASTGWTFNGSTQYLTTGILPDYAQTWSAIVRFSDSQTSSANTVLFGVSGGVFSYFLIRPNLNNHVSYVYSAYDINEPYAKSPGMTSGVLAMAGTKGYRNGVDDNISMGPNASFGANRVSIGAMNSSSLFYNGKMQALAFYIIIITAPQVLAITNAMNALSGSTPPQYNTTTIRDTGTKYAGSASAKIVTGGAAFPFTQSLNVGNTDSYTISAYAYTTGAEVTASDVQLYHNGSAITTGYFSVGSGWYLLSGTVTGANAPRQWGVEVKANKTVFIDNFEIR